jgi:hypothetical protein
MLIINIELSIASITRSLFNFGSRELHNTVNVAQERSITKISSDKKFNLGEVNAINQD